MIRLSSLTSASAMVSKRFSKRHVLHAALLLDTGLERTLVGQRTRLALVLEHAELIAGVGDGLQAQDLDGVGRTGLGDGVALWGRAWHGRGHR